MCIAILRGAPARIIFFTAAERHSLLRRQPGHSTFSVFTLVARRQIIYAIATVDHRLRENGATPPRQIRRKEMKVESNNYFEGATEEPKHCLRSTGAQRAWFFTREEAENFAANPANPIYYGDIAHQWAKCGFYHLSRPEWLEPKFTSADLQMLEDAGIETPPRLDKHFRCSICGSVMRDGVEFLIMPDGSVRCILVCSRPKA
jgi:hypothetical protein